MNYGQLKKLTMQLAFSESIAGTPIAPSYNNQSDYLRMIPGLANDGMMYIATTVKRIPEIVPLCELESECFGSYTVYTMPKDFWRLHNGGLIWKRPDQPFDESYSVQRFHGYKVIGNNKIFVPNNTPNLNCILVEYYRYPKQLKDDVADNVELDNTPETHAALPYYIAAQLVMYDDPFRYSSLSNEFETRLGRITEPIMTEYAPVEDAYAGFTMLGV